MNGNLAGGSSLTNNILAENADAPCSLFSNVNGQVITIGNTKVNQKTTIGGINITGINIESMTDLLIGAYWATNIKIGNEWAGLDFTGPRMGQC